MIMDKRQWSTIFRVGALYRCEITFSKRAGIRAQWWPAAPRELPPECVAEYRAGRDALLAEISREIGAVVVIEAR